MDAIRFDRLARMLAIPTARRGIVRLLAATPPGAALAALLAETSDAARRRQTQQRRAARRDHLHDQRKNKNKKCAKVGQAPNKKRKKCCSGLVKDGSGRCAAASSPSPPPSAPPCDVCASGCPFSAVQAAIDAASPGATITLCAGTFTETIEIGKNLTLIGAGDGAGAGNTTLDAADAGSVVRIEKETTVSLQNLRLTGGNANFGGGIFNDGTLALTVCTVIGNTAPSNGGGIFNFGSVVITDSLVTANTAGIGGGIANAGGTLALFASEVTENTADAGGGIGDGGGIYNQPGSVASLEASRVTANHAATLAGGIYNAGAVNCRDDSTVSDNTAGGQMMASNCLNTGVGGTGCATCPA